MNRIIIVLFAILLTACAGTPKYPSTSASDAACVKGDMANFFKFFSAGEAHVHIKEIDGVPTEGGTGPFCFAPGKHRLGISGYNNHQTAQDYVELTFESGKKYWIRGNLRGMNVYFELIDITSSEEKVAEFNMRVNMHSNPAPIPIFIPVVR
jgi:hypothetical protein